MSLIIPCFLDGGYNMSLGNLLRQGMRRLASGVCVITTEAQGQRYAMTASSVTSLSDNPASLLVCVNTDTAIHPHLSKGHPFAVNILSASQQAISNKCAERDAGEERFSIGEWGSHQESQLPYLETAQAVFFCEVDNDNYIYGTHQVVIGRLTDINIPDDDVDPLIYVNGGYQLIVS